jgi:hypothetical protein
MQALHCSLEGHCTSDPPSQLDSGPCAILPASLDGSYFPITNPFATGPAPGSAEEVYLQVLGRIETDLLDPVSLTQTLAPAAAAARSHAARLAHLLPPAPVVDTDPSPPSAGSPPATIEAWAHAIYDRFFHVTRLCGMTVGQLAAQAAATTANLLDDLPRTMLNRSEPACLLYAAALLQRHLGGISGGPPATVSPQAAPTYLAADSDPVALTFHRWRVGHHFFALCCQVCADALQAAAEAAAASNVEAAAVAVRVASPLLRGTTAAMWYAADFPRAFYMRYVRPSMAATVAPGGFSGNQNPDHARLSRARRALRETLLETFGTTAGRWPSPLREAMHDFHSTNVEDNEHHTLIAAAKVGQDMSLAQMSWQDQLPAHLRNRSAVDVLRRMTDLKRAEYDF